MSNKYIKKNNGSYNDKSKIIRELAPYTTLGIQLVLTIGVCAYIGWLIDDSYDTKPVFVIVLSFFGVIAGMVTFIRTVLKKNKKK